MLIWSTKYLRNLFRHLSFKLNASDFQSSLDNVTVSPELVNVFKSNGFTLSADTTISVEENGSRWLISDKGARFVVKKEVDKLEISFYPQTGLTTNELGANPEHVNVNVYTKVPREQVYPWQLPFDLFAEAVRAYLHHLGISRYGLMQTFPKPDVLPKPYSTVETMIASEYFEFTDKEFKIITGNTLEDDWEFWGYPAGPSGGTWLDDLRQVQTLLEKSGLSYQELVELLKMKYIDPNNAITIATSEKESDATVTCDTSKLIVANLTNQVQVLNRIHLFIRLWRRLGWTMRELDRAIMALNAGVINENFVLQLYYIQQLHKEFDTPITTMLTWYSYIDTTRYDDDDQVPILKSPYEELFQNPSVIVLDPDPFLLNLKRTELEKVGDLTRKNIISAVIASFRYN